MAKPALLIFGELSPTETPAAAHTVQAALSLCPYATITIIIADHAPIPTELPAGIQLKRHRDLAHMQESEKKAARLFIIGDSAESLDTLKIYLQFPGPVISATPSLYRLFIAHLKTEDGWPHSYTHWLARYFGNQAEPIAQALLRQNRESQAIADEIAAEMLFPDLSRNQQSLPRLMGHIPVGLFPRPLYPEDSAASSGPPRQLLVIGPSGAAREAVQNLTDLGQIIHLETAPGAHPSIEEKIKAADLILVTEGKRGLPAYLPLVFLHGKPLMAAGQRWASQLVAPSFSAPHPDAAQHLTAAIGAFITQPAIRAWLGEHSKTISRLFQALNWEQLLPHIAREADIPLSATPEIADDIETAPVSQPKLLLNTPPGKGPFALLGAVPPKAVLSRIYPSLDLGRSPKFATEALCRSLQSYIKTPLPILLSQLGYEAPIFKNDDTEQVEQILRQLRNADRALSFGPQISGAYSAGEHINSYLKKAPLHISVKFPSFIQEGTLSGYEADSGLLWNIDAVRGTVSCVIILEVAGRYKIKLQAEATLTIASAHSTQRLTNHTPVYLETNSIGLLYFTLSVEESLKKPENYSEMLTKSLADYPLNLEWLDHG